MKKVVFTVVSVLFCTCIIAQNAPQGKEVMYVENFSYTNNIGSSFVEALKNKVIEGLVATDRLMIKDVNAEASLKQENQKRTEDASSVDESTLTAMRNLNANYLLQGHVLTMKSVLVRNNDGTRTHKATVSYALKIIDVATGTLRGSKSYEHSGSSSKTDNEAIMDAMTLINSDMRGLIEENFKLRGTILELSGDKKGVPTEAYIDLGTLVGIKKDQRFDVCVEREVAGRLSQKKIGEIRVTAVEGEDLSNCKIGKGAKEIKAAMGEGTKLVIVSAKEKMFDGLF